MKTDWPRLQANLTDWGRDDIQAKNAIDQTTAALQQGLVKIKASVRQSVQEFIAAAGKEKKKSYPKIAQDIQSKWGQLTKLHGKPPTLDTPDEQAGFDLAKSIIQGTATADAFDKHMNSMIVLQNLLDKGLKQSQQPKTTASASRPLSKRALTLGDGTAVSLFGPGKAAKQRARGQRSRPIVTTLQRNINDINNYYYENVSDIEDDGILGPRTRSALTHALKAIGKTEYDLGQGRVAAISVVNLNKLFRPYVSKARLEMYGRAPKRDVGETGMAGKQADSYHKEVLSCNVPLHVSQ